MRQNELAAGLLLLVKKILKVIVIAFSILFVFYLVIFFLFLHGITKWNVHKISPAEKSHYAEYAFLPGIDDALERYATRGMQDVESQLETYAYKNLDKLYEALPKAYRPAIEHALKKSSPVEKTDVKGKKAEAYRISADLPIDRDESDEAICFERRSYYVYKYKNGKYRFVIQNY